MEVTAAAPVALEISQVTGAQGGNALQQSAYAIDRALVDHVATFQSQGSFGHQVGNPAALGSEALKFLEGYMQRVAKLQNNSGERVDSANVSKDNSGTIEIASVDGSGISSGPASKALEPSETTSALNGAGGAVSIGGTDVEQAVKLLSEILSYSVETQAIMSITTNMTKATSTLLRGS